MPDLEQLLGDSRREPAASQRLGWDYSRWHNTLGSVEHPHPAALAALEDLEDRWAIDGGISRQAVEDVGRRNGDLALFVAAMVWGFGSIDYGATRTAKMLQTDNVESIVASMVSAAQTSAEQGFSSLFSNRATRITGLGVAMGTKLLYFAGRIGCATPPAPLVYDLKVYNALRELDDGYAAAPNPRGYVRAVDYVGLLDFIGDAAGEADLEPDDVEYALFGYDVWIRRRTRLDGLSAPAGLITSSERR